MLPTAKCNTCEFKIFLKMFYVLIIFMLSIWNNITKVKECNIPFVLWCLTLYRWGAHGV